MLPPSHPLHLCMLAVGDHATPPTAAAAAMQRCYGFPNVPERGRHACKGANWSKGGVEVGGSRLCQPEPGLSSRAGDCLPQRRVGGPSGGSVRACGSFCSDLICPLHCALASLTCPARPVPVRAGSSHSQRRRRQELAVAGPAHWGLNLSWPVGAPACAGCRPLPWGGSHERCTCTTVAQLFTRSARVLAGRPCPLLRPRRRLRGRFGALHHSWRLYKGSPGPASRKPRADSHKWPPYRGDLGERKQWPPVSSPSVSNLSTAPHRI